MMTPYLEHICVDKLPWGHWNDFQNHIKFKEFIAKEEKYVTPEATRGHHCPSAPPQPP